MYMVTQCPQIIFSRDSRYRVISPTAPRVKDTEGTQLYPRDATLKGTNVTRINWDKVPDHLKVGSQTHSHCNVILHQFVSVGFSFNVNTKIHMTGLVINIF